MFKSLRESDLVSFQEAILKDYGVKLEGKELYDAPFSLLQFIDALIKFSKDDEKDKAEGSKVVLDNPLNTDGKKDTIK